MLSSTCRYRIWTHEGHEYLPSPQPDPLGYQNFHSSTTTEQGTISGSQLSQFSSIYAKSPPLLTALPRQRRHDSRTSSWRTRTTIGIRGVSTLFPRIKPLKNTLNLRFRELLVLGRATVADAVRRLDEDRIIDDNRMVVPADGKPDGYS